MRIFLDANILFSAAKSAGAIQELFRRTAASGHVFCVDGYVVAEARRNLERKAPDAIPTFDALVARAESGPLRNNALPQEIAGFLPEKDRPVLAAALHMNCQALLSGDSTHFGPLYGSCVLGVAIYSPRLLAEALGFARSSAH